MCRAAEEQHRCEGLVRDNAHISDKATVIPLFFFFFFPFPWLQGDPALDLIELSLLIGADEALRINFCPEHECRVDSCTQ